MDKVLLIEDVDSLRDVLASVLQSEGFAVDAYSTGEEALTHLGTQHYSCILCDFKLPGLNGIEVLKKTRQANRTVPFLIMTAFGSVDIAVEAMREGANDFLTKPFEPSVLCNVMHEVIKHKRIVDRSAGLETRRQRKFISKSAAMQRTLTQAGKVARVDTSVLILGESGTGKELIARFIHENSPRAEKPFVAVNCAAMPADLLESEFFGHEAGSFTGATQTRIGVLEIASDGTIFLDEIGDMPAALQVKLLRAIQEREVKRVGGNKIIKINPRIVAATNQDVEELMKSGAMRDDFYYRIAVLTLQIPPLRDRPEDVELLTKHFVEYFSSHIGRPEPTIEPAAWAVLKSYRWPGNARELENVIERAVILAEKTIRAEHLGIEAGQGVDDFSSEALSLIEVSQQASRRAEIELIRKILQKTLGNKSKAAHILGVSYKTLLNKVKEYHLDSGSAPEQSHSEEHQQ